MPSGCSCRLINYLHLLNILMDSGGEEGAGEKRCVKSFFTVNIGPYSTVGLFYVFLFSFYSPTFKNNSQFSFFLEK